ncbi:MAG: lamin tail domain-containing protein [Salinibacter sp.]
MSRLGVVFICWVGLLLSSALPPPSVGQSSPDSGDVVINEIQYAPTPSTNEYIELYNQSGDPVNLGALEYADANDDFAPVASSDTLLPDGAYVVLARDSAAFAAAFPEVPPLVPPDWDALNNGGDRVQVRHVDQGTLLDVVSYTPSWGGDDGASLERIDPAGPSDRASNFGTSTAAAGGTPAAENSLYAPDTTAPTLTRATPTPKGDTVVAEFSEPVADSSISAASFSIPAPDAPTVVSAAPIPDASATVACVLSTPLSAGTYTLTAVDIADRRGNVQAETQATFEFVETTPPDSGDVVINEVMYAPLPASNEFIELYNRSEKPIDLGSLSYADEDRDFAPVSTPRRPLRPDSFVVLARDSSAFVSAFPDVSFLTPDGWDALNNSGDEVLVRHDPTGTTIDRVPYDAAWGGSDGQSLERIDPAAPSTTASTFASSTAPRGATPGAQNSQYDPDRTAPSVRLAEETAQGDAAVHFSEPVARASITPDAFQVDGTPPSSVELQADSVARLSLPSAPKTGTTIQIQNVKDRVGNTLESSTRPLALQPDSGDVVVNEIMYAPRTDPYDDTPDQVEYVELLNRSDRRLTLNRLRLTDRPTEEGVADTLEAGRPRSLVPDGYALVAAAPDAPSSPTESQLAGAFPEAPLTADSVAFLPVVSPQIGLTNTGGQVRVHRADTALVARVSYRPDWHAPALDDPTGTALERISPDGRANAADNWTSSTAPPGGTPGRENSVSHSGDNDSPEADGLTIAPSPFSIEQDGGTRIEYRLDGEPNLVRVRIYDARGRKVRTLEEARLSGRRGTLVWNGRDGEGNRVRVGIYVVLFEAVRTDEGTIAQYKEPVVVARSLN